MYIMHIDIWYMTESLALQLRLFLTELNTVVLLYLKDYGLCSYFMKIIFVILRNVKCYF